MMLSGKRAVLSSGKRAVGTVVGFVPLDCKMALQHVVCVL